MPQSLNGQKNVYGTIKTIINNKKKCITVSKQWDNECPNFHQIKNGHGLLIKQ
jgi:hypothetical protein